jgi:hypothetical protein
LLERYCSRMLRTRRMNTGNATWDTCMHAPQQISYHCAKAPLILLLMAGISRAYRLQQRHARLAHATDSSWLTWGQRATQALGIRML